MAVALIFASQQVCLLLIRSGLTLKSYISKDLLNVWLCRKSDLLNLVGSFDSQATDRSLPRSRKTDRSNQTPNLEAPSHELPIL
jgi:hypothetical protein